MTGDCTKTKACSALAKILQILLARRGIVRKKTLAALNLILPFSLSPLPVPLWLSIITHTQSYQPVKEGSLISASYLVHQCYQDLVPQRLYIPLKKVQAHKSLRYNFKN